MGRVSVDFAAANDAAGRWSVYALEANLRKGGTTHPYAVLRNLVPGRYDVEAGTWVAQDGSPRAHRCTDNLVAESWLGLPPKVVIDAVQAAGPCFDYRTGTGVVLHMLNGLGIDGRLGVTALGTDPADAQAKYVAASDGFIFVIVLDPLQPLVRTTVEVEKVGDIQGGEHRTDEERHVAPRFVRNDPRRHEPFAPATDRQLTGARRQHVLDPVGVRSVGEGDHVSAWPLEDVDRRSIGAPRAPAGVGDDAEARQPPSDQRADAVGDNPVEAGHLLGDHHRSLSSSF